MSIPFIRKPVDYIMSVETQMDFEGKRKQKRRTRSSSPSLELLDSYGGLLYNSCRQLCILSSVVALSCLIVLPPWPFLRRTPLPWQPIEVKKAPKKAPETKKK